jgi:hypothetical protein
MINYMKKFNCHKCGKHFAQQINLDYHLQKKNPCDKFIKNINNLNNFNDINDINDINNANNINIADDNDNNNVNDTNNINNTNDINNANDITNPNNINAKKLREYMDRLKCVYCNSEFTRKSSVLNHIKHNCKKVKEIEEEKHKIFLKLKEEEEIKIKLKEEEKNKIKFLEDEVSKLKNALEDKDKKFEEELSKIKKSITKKSTKKSTKKVTKNKNLGDNSNNTNLNINSHNNIDNSINDSNIQQNIFLANYTGSGMPPIPQEEIIPLLKRGFQTSVELTKKVHFNPKYPEFHNVYIPRINEKYGMIYIDNKWRVTDRDELVNDIYENKRAYVIENLDTFIKQLDENKKKSLKRWLDRDDDDESIKNTKEDIKRVLFDNRHMAMSRKKEMEKQNKKQLNLVSLPKKQSVPVIEEYKSDSDNSSYTSNYSYDKDNKSRDSFSE